MTCLLLLRGAQQVQVVELLRPLHLGRSAANDLVLLDDTVSSHHCVIWEDGEGVWVEDLGSANGTWIDETQTKGPVQLQPGQRLRIGGEDGPALVIDTESVAAVPQDVLWHLEDQSARVRMPIRGDRFEIGAADGSDLRLASGPPRAATLLFHDSGEVWLGQDADDRLLEPEETFEIEGRRLVLVPPASGRAPTVIHDPDRYDYRVAASLAEPMPRAEVSSRRAGHSWAAEDDNRAVLLYLLARRFDEDRIQGEIPRAQWGWIPDEQLVTGVWGRNRPADEINSLNVLIHRIRRGVKKAGLDPWFLEKQRRSVRIRVSDVVLA